MASKLSGFSTIARKGSGRTKQVDICCGQTDRGRSPHPLQPSQLQQCGPAETIAVPNTTAQSKPTGNSNSGIIATVPSALVATFALQPINHEDNTSILQFPGPPVVYFVLQSIQSINVMLALAILQFAGPLVAYFVLQSIQSINVM